MTSLLLAALALSVQAQQTQRNAPLSFENTFADRAFELGVIHEGLAGYDEIGGPGGPMADWAQHGIALGDLSGDGQLDIVACAGLYQNRIFVRAGGHYLDVTDGAGIVSSELDRTPALGDVDRDGDLDLFLGALEPGDGPLPGRSRLYRLDDDPRLPVRFEDVTSLSGTIGRGHTIHARFSDLDLDGLLDLYLAEFQATANVLYRNLGRLAFEEVSGVVESAGTTHVVAAIDLNDDGLPELLAGNDWEVADAIGLNTNAPDRLFRNLGDCFFTDASAGSGLGNVATTMGIAFGDVDYDGDLDVYRTEYGTNFLNLNRDFFHTGLGFPQSQGVYGLSDSHVPVPDPIIPGLSGPAVGWGVGFVDMDADRWLDLLVVNGHVGSDFTQQVNRLFRGLGPDVGFAFADIAGETGFDAWSDDRALSIGDLDGDNDPDALVMPTSGFMRLHENRLVRHGSFVHVSAVGGTSAPNGEGTHITWVDSDNYHHPRRIGADGSTASQHALETVFGLGDAPSADLVVTFPSGLALTRTALPGERVVAVEPELVRVEPASLIDPSGTETITVTAFSHDASGAPRDDLTVTIDVAGATAQGPVQALGGNAYQRVFDAPTEPGAYPVSISFGSFTPRVEPRLRIGGPIDPTATRLRLAPLAVRAGSGELVDIVCAPRTAEGLVAGAGHEVRLSTPAGEILLNDLGDGRYSGSTTAPASAGDYALSVRIDGGVLAPVGTLTSADVPSPATSELVLETPNPTFASIPESIRLRTTPRDAAGRSLGPGALVTLDFAMDGGSTEPTITAEIDQDDGDHIFALRQTDGQPAVGTLTVRADGVVIGSVPFDF